jgi:hypothetical protein
MAQPQKPKSKKASAAGPVRAVAVVAVAPVFPTSCWADLAEDEDTSIPDVPAEWKVTRHVEITEVSAKATGVVAKKH